MGRRTPTRSMFLGALVVALIVPSVSIAARGPAERASAPRARSTDPGGADLAVSLGPDGTFRGTAGVTGTVDTRAWTLVSDLSRGQAPRFARTDAATTPAAAGPWSALGSNSTGDGALNGLVTDIAVSGPDVYVAGYFSNVAGIPAADKVAKWNGVAWSALGSNGSDNGAISVGDVFALAVSGTDLYVGGSFMDAAGIDLADKVARWDGSAWSAVGAYHGAFNGWVNALAVSGSNLYVGGAFTDAAGNSAADKIVGWNGAWFNLGSNGLGDGALDNDVYAIAAFGPGLFVGGDFNDAAGIATADHVASWDGSEWAALGSNGASDGAINDSVFALAFAGSHLYAGGDFTDAAGIGAADYVAGWDGSNWSALGSNGGGDGALNYRVYDLAVKGSKVFAGGEFADAAGKPAADNIAKWNGTAWSALGSNGAGGALNSRVNAIAVSIGGLIVGGQFADAAGVPAADGVAKWALGGPRRPDGRIRLGTTGAFAGDDIYNTTGAGQGRTGSAARGATITFGISVQNDAPTNSDRFTLKATGAATSQYTVKYLDGATDVTSAVVAGTYLTGFLAPGTQHLITVTVKVKSTAATSSAVTRLVTIRSVGDATKRDAVTITGKRA